LLVGLASIATNMSQVGNGILQCTDRRDRENFPWLVDHEIKDTVDQALTRIVGQIMTDRSNALGRNWLAQGRMAPSTPPPTM
jgi:hypothetical protein